MKFIYRGNCKTSGLRKIDDFEANSQDQHVGPCRADDIILENVGEEARREVASKGRFCDGREFCNCLFKYYFSTGWARRFPLGEFLFFMLIKKDS